MADEPTTPDPDAPDPTEEPDAPEPFDEARARDKIRKANAEAKALRTRLKEAEAAEAELAKIRDAQKSDADKAAEAVAAATDRAERAEADLLRLQVATDKGLSAAQAKRLVGTTREELEADADELLATFTPEDKPEPRRTPRERLRPGTVPTAEPEETDPRKLAELVQRRSF